VLAPKPIKDSTAFQTFLANLAACKVKYIMPDDKPATRELEATLDLKFFAPASPRSKNASSILVRVDDTETGTSQLLTGDTTPEAWAEIRARFPRRHIRAITAPHHGGDRVLLDLVKKTSPEHIIIQAEDQNQYRHPNLRLLRDLARLGTDVDLRQRDDLEQRLEEQDALFVRFAQAQWKREDWKPIINSQIGRAYSRLWLDMLENHPLAPSLKKREATFHTGTEAMQLRVLANDAPLRYAQVLLTSERGDIRIKRDHVSFSKPTPDAFLEEAIWYRARYLTDQEIETLSTWQEARAYLTLHVYEDLRILHETLSPPPPLSADEEIENARIDRYTRVFDAVDLRKPRTFPSFIAYFAGGRRRVPAWHADYERIRQFLHIEQPLPQIAERYAGRDVLSDAIRVQHSRAATLFQAVQDRDNLSMERRRTNANYSIKSVLDSGRLRGLTSIILPSKDLLREAPTPFATSGLLWASDFHEFDPRTERAKLFGTAAERFLEEREEREFERRMDPNGERDRMRLERKIEERRPPGRR
jgi:hypothetical protein